MNNRSIPLAALLAIGVFAISDAWAETPPDFSGDWVARDATNDNNASKTGDTSGPHSHGGHGGGGHMGGGHSGMGGGGGRSHGAQSGTPLQVANPLAPVPRLDAQAMIIRQTDDIFDIEVNGQRMAYRFDGKHNYGPQYGGTVSLTWAQPEMVIETHPDGGGTIEEHYTLAPDGSTLTMLARTERPGDSNVREIKRVFVHPDDDGLKTASGIVLP